MSTYLIIMGGLGAGSIESGGRSSRAHWFTLDCTLDVNAQLVVTMKSDAVSPQPKLMQHRPYNNFPLW